MTVSIVNPFPGTALYNQCKRDKLFTHKYDEDKLWNKVIDEYTKKNDMAGGLNFFKK